MHTSTNKSASTFMVVLAFAIVYIVWGSTYFFILKALQGFPPFILGALRFIIAGLILMGWSLVRGEKIFVLKNIKHAAISGVLLLFVGTGIVIWAEQYLPSALVAIVLSSEAIFFMLLDKPKWKENFSNKATIIGLVVGFAGIVLLFGEKITSAFSTVGNKAELAALGLLIVACISWAAGSLYSKHKLTSGSATVNTSWQMLAAGIAFIPGIFFRGETQHLYLQNIPTSAWMSLLYLVFLGSIAGFSAYVWLLQVRPATQVSTHAYVNPVVAVLLGVFFANEKISLLQVTGLVIILASVSVISLAKYRKENKTPKPVKEVAGATALRECVN